MHFIIVLFIEIHGCILQNWELYQSNYLTGCVDRQFSLELPQQTHSMSVGICLQLLQTHHSTSGDGCAGWGCCACRMSKMSPGLLSAACRSSSLTASSDMFAMSSYKEKKRNTFTVDYLTVCNAFIQYSFMCIQAETAFKKSPSSFAKIKLWCPWNGHLNCFLIQYLFT